MIENNKKLNKIIGLQDHLRNKGITLSGKESITDLKKIKLRIDLIEKGTKLSGNESLSELKKIRLEKQLKNRGFEFTMNKSRSELALIDYLLNNGIIISGTESKQYLKKLKLQTELQKKGINFNGDESLSKLQRIRLTNRFLKKGAKLSGNDSTSELIIIKSKLISSKISKQIENLKHLKSKSKQQNEPKNTTKYSPLILDLKSCLNNLGENGKVSKSVAQRFIEKSAWRIKHPCGRPVRAPNHSLNIYGTEYSWKIDFGSNTFLVGKAILRTRDTFDNFLSASNKGNIQSFHSLCNKLRLDISGSVENFFGEYLGYYPLDSIGYMRFGTQAISTKDFINLLFKLVPVIKLYKNINIDDLAKDRLL